MRLKLIEKKEEMNIMNQKLSTSKKMDSKFIVNMNYRYTGNRD